jgi:hypothetical protein
MRHLRNVVLQRLCAVLLLAGVGSTLIPTVEAMDTRVDALGELFADRDAVIAGLSAADGSTTPEARADAFARSYALESEEPVTSAEIIEILVGSAFRHVAPDSPDAAFVPAAPAAPAPRAGFAGAATLGGTTGPNAPTGFTAAPVLPQISVQKSLRPTPQRSRAP